MHTFPDIEDELQPLEGAIRYSFLPSLTGRQALLDTERELLALPARHGGLRILNPTECANSQFNASTKVLEPLVSIDGQQNAILFQSKHKQSRGKQKPQSNHATDWLPQMKQTSSRQNSQKPSKPQWNKQERGLSLANCHSHCRVWLKPA